MKISRIAFSCLKQHSRAYLAIPSRISCGPLLMISSAFFSTGRGGLECVAECLVPCHERGQTRLVLKGVNSDLGLLIESKKPGTPTARDIHREDTLPDVNVFAILLEGKVSPPQARHRHLKECPVDISDWSRCVG